MRSAAIPAILLATSLALGKPSLALGRPSVALGQPATQPGAAAAGGVASGAEGSGGGGGGITLNFPDNVPLKVLVDYTATRLNWNIVYDETQVSQRITLRANTPVSEASLPGLLETVLRSKGLSLVDAGNGFKRIVPLAGAAVQAKGPVAGGGIVTQVFRLTAAEPERVDAVVKPMLTSPGGSSTSVPDGRMLIVTDTAEVVGRVEELIRRIDKPGRDVAIEFIPIRHAEAAAITKQLSTLLTAKVRAGKGRGEAVEGGAGEPTVDVSHDPRTNQLLLVAPREMVAEAREIVASLDVPVTESQSPVRFYKLANATAVDVLATIQSLGGGSPPSDGRTSQAPGANTFNSVGTSLVNPPRAGGPAGAGGLGTGGQGSGAEGSAAGPATPGVIGGPSAGQRSSPAQLLAQTPVAVREAIRGRPAQVTADPNTNTIIVIAEPAVQALYEQLIRAMDKRRPQVLIEATIVTIDTTDNFSLGVELGRGTGGSEDNIITFSSFGLSTPDPTTGQLALAPGAGFNGTLINSKVASVVVRALAQSTRARVQAAPRILVNDNASGTLQSVAEQPFTSVNAGDTISTTSFAGYAEAGTQITVTPHISEADYLQLDYDVTLSSFTANAGTNGVPPPRQRDAVQSRVTIPDGHTIIVGGLNRTSYLRTKDAVPFLGEIPILEYLFSRRTNSNRETTLFVFIRPVILRDDQFEDLKFLSERDAQKAEIQGDYPTSDPLTIDSSIPSPGGPPPGP